MLSSDLSTERLVLTAMSAEHATERYLGWLNDPEVTQYLETRFQPQSLEVIRRFIEEVRSSAHSYQFAIVERASGNHIGNIKIGPINPNHASASIGLFIGERAAWGQGFATEAIGVLSRWAFEVLNLEKLTAGAYEQNAGSVAAFRRCGFEIEGVQRGQVARDQGGRRDNVVLMGMTAADHANSNGKVERS
jgi:ribosomal-protein-alanine N-acetyltransferase